MVMKKNETKLTKDELSEILMINTEYQEVLIKFGQLSLEKKHLEQERKKIENFEQEYTLLYEEVEKKEKNFKERIVRKYGDGEIDLESGFYIRS